MKQLALPAIFLLALLPFAGRPFFFDDGSVAISAAAAARVPLRPHHFKIDLDTPDKDMWPAGGLPSYTHPPLTAWTLGAVAKACGEREVPFHLAMFLTACAALWAARKLANEFTPRADAAAGLLAFSPAFFLTSLTLYPHLLYFLFWTLTLLCCFCLCRSGSPKAGLAMGTFLTLAALSLHQWPLMLPAIALVYWHRGRRTPGAGGAILAGLFLFLLAYGGWCLWEIHLHGMCHFWATYRVRAAGGASTYPWAAAFLPLVFMAGAFPAVALAWPVLFRERKKLICAFAAFLPLLFGVFLGPWGGFSRGQAALLSFFLVTGAVFVTALFHIFKNRRGADSLLLGWFLLEFAFVQRFLTFPSGHHLLTLSFLAALLVTRLGERPPLSLFARRLLPVLPAVFTLCLAQADFSQALVGPRIAKDMPAPEEGKSFFWGNSFGAYERYLRKAGWQTYDRRRPPQKGDYVLVSRHVNAAGGTAFLRGFPFMVVQDVTYPQKNPLRTLSLVAGAGWYSASWGALPYSFFIGPAEEFVLLRMT